MNTRYNFLTNKDEYDAINSLRDAFLAARNGAEVNEIINAILTSDEKIKIGRRIQIASMLSVGMKQEQIRSFLQVGKETVTLVSEKMINNSHGFKLISKRHKKVEQEYSEKKFKKVGASKLIKKKIVYSGFKKKDVER